MRGFMVSAFALVAVGLGAGAGYIVKGEAAVSQGGADEEAADAPARGKAGAGREPEVETEFVKMQKQFVVPVVERERMTQIVVLSLSLEVRAGKTDKIYALEPKLRDRLLRALFDHANGGGFDGDFTSRRKMTALRRALTETARGTAGTEVEGVLVTDLVRQEQ